MGIDIDRNIFGFEIIWMVIDQVGNKSDES